MSDCKQLLTMQSIFKLCDLVDDVLFELRLNGHMYNKTTLEKALEPEHPIAESGIYFMTMAEGMNIKFVDELTLREINEKYLSLYLPLARKLLRGGLPYPYTISEQVTDDYLDELLCVRFRDLLRIIVLTSKGNTL
ncbi:MAG: hypothetical protein RR063_08325 [Anaerovoracaceae bacterium]